MNKPSRLQFEYNRFIDTYRLNKTERDALNTVVGQIALDTSKTRVAVMQKAHKNSAFAHDVVDCVRSAVASL